MAFVVKFLRGKPSCVASDFSRSSEEGGTDGRKGNVTLSAAEQPPDNYSSDVAEEERERERETERVEREGGNRN